MSKAAIHAIQSAVISDSGLGCHLLAALMKVSIVLSRNACCDCKSSHRLLNVVTSFTKSALKTLQLCVSRQIVY